MQLDRWLSGVIEQPAMRAYKSHESLARRLMSVNPRLTESRAEFLSRSVSCVRADGMVAMACDPWHKIPSPTLYRVEDSMASWWSITAPVLMLVADQGFIHQRFANNPEELQRRMGCFKDRLVVTVSDASHDLQHDQPEQVATALDHFLVK